MSTRNDGRLSHLHVVIDYELREAIEAYARGRTPRREHPNVSDAVRDLLRSVLCIDRGPHAPPTPLERALTVANP